MNHITPVRKVPGGAFYGNSRTHFVPDPVKNSAAGTELAVKAAIVRPAYRLPIKDEHAKPVLESNTQYRSRQGYDSKGNYK